MSNPGVGGRGKKAPYESIHQRTPMPIKPMMEVLVSRYRELVMDYADPEDPALLAQVASALAPRSGDSHQELEAAHRKAESLQTELKNLQRKLNERDQMLSELFTIHDNYDAQVKDKIKKALDT
ncbi:hypothetical protein [Nostoc sp. DedQUE07]|uniref:hypothetical protein n=1 Tax=Nostoc sp. DedQUE07 TaxID=3075392 RepID=UPI002AD466DB|nr:hypothetical protein [Nostoc sp. DedQUE07]MDZ8131957.1 hypothetical protein [Nostoc sp. DedQUE07]